MDVSENYKHWIGREDWKRCVECKNLHGKIWSIDEVPEPEPPLHPSCRCVIENMESIKAGTATTKGTDGADWALKYEGKLPDFYITIDEIEDFGWRSQKRPKEYAPDKMITGGIYQNRNGHLPNAPGRIWHEADINYEQGKRNSLRSARLRRTGKHPEPAAFQVIQDAEPEFAALMLANLESRISLQPSMLMPRTTQGSGYILMIFYLFTPQLKA